MKTLLIPSNVLNVLRISEATNKQARPPLVWINYDADSNSFASTDSYRLTDFEVNPNYKQEDFPNYKSFFPTFNTSDTRYKSIKLSEAIAELQKFKGIKKTYINFRENYSVLWNTNDKIEETIQVPSTMFNFLEGTSVDTKFLIEFISSLKDIAKENIGVQMEVYQENQLTPLAFRITLLEGTLKHIIMPVKISY